MSDVRALMTIGWRCSASQPALAYRMPYSATSPAQFRKRATHWRPLVADDFAKEVRELYAQAEEADRDNRDEARLDLKFEGGEQWDERDRNARERAGLPVITVNVVQQYTGMVVGDWLQNETSIKVLPREDGDTNIAEVRSELIRSIELQSKAPRVYAACLGQMVACGISNFRVDVDFAYEDAFAQDIFISDIPDPLAVRWDPLAFDPTGRDASYCFVGDKISDRGIPPPLSQGRSAEPDPEGMRLVDGKTVQLPRILEDHREAPHVRNDRRRQDHRPDRRSAEEMAASSQSTSTPSSRSSARRPSANTPSGHHERHGATGRSV
jgi:hypothetical protein